MIGNSTDQMTWYQWGHGGFFRNLYWAWSLSVAYLLIAFAPLLVSGLYGHYSRTSVTIFAQSWLGFVWSVVTSLGFPVWKWAETWSFENWLLTQGDKVRERERQHFAAMSDSSRNFWTAVIAIYTIVGVWSIALAKP